MMKYEMSLDSIEKLIDNYGYEGAHKFITEQFERHLRSTMNDMRAGRSPRASGETIILDIRIEKDG